MDQYSHRYSVTAADMDTRYRITPNAILLYYQDAWARFMGCLHMAAFDVVKYNLMWVISEFNAWFSSDTAFWGEDIDVVVWNSEVSALRVYADFRILKTDKTELAHGYGCWTLLDTQTHQLRPLSALPHPLPVLPQFTTDSHKKLRYPTEGTPLNQIEHKVNPINLDFNKHVNNRTYLSIAMQFADSQFMDEHAITTLSIRWLCESFLGDTLRCRLTLLPRDQKDGVYAYLQKIERDGGEAAAQIYSEWAPRTFITDITLHASRT